MSIVNPKTVWRVHDGVKSALLIDAQEYYRAFYQAASRAKRSILLLGWQFDSDVQLLRGPDLPARANPADYQLLPFLDRLSRERKELAIKVLAWDHSVFFALEREMLQKVVFDIATLARFEFQLDDTVPLGGSHHQKVAIIDGQLAFLGSADICQDRWDTSAHVASHPLRVSRRLEPNKPYHEVQVALAGEAARSLLDLFAERWEYATGEILRRKALVVPNDDVFSAIVPTLAMPPAQVALSRTVPSGEDREPVREIRDLHVGAIESAERMIYIETQYLTSCCVRDALVSRMSNPRKPKLEVVIVLPRKPENLKEELTIGAPQGGVLAAIGRAAREGGHALGIYNVAAERAAESAATPSVFVYIHSKLMIVDDVLMTIGSANLANRSMTVDSEINATWMARPGDHALRAAIRRARVRLLLEHLGEAGDVRVVTGRNRLVARLDHAISARRGRLYRHDVHQEEKGGLTKVVQDFACEYVDPKDGAEPLPPSSARPSAA